MREFPESHSAVASKIAQQVQDSLFPLGGTAPRTSSAILWHMRTAAPGKPDPDNIRSLRKDKGYEYRDTPDVVWHPLNPCHSSDIAFPPIIWQTLEFPDLS
jgi:hypothetical protein